MKVHKPLLALLVLAANALLVSSAWAAAVASVDRPNVDLNESFTLEVSVDVVTDSEPDFSILEDDFYVGQVSKLSSTSIVNGQMTRSMTWSVSLMAKRTGTIQIPPITVGAERSNGVPIVVNEPTNAPPGEADVFVTSDVDVDETWVQAQILYRIRIYRAVPTRQPALREPTISGAETLVELAGDDRQYESVLNGKPYSVIERTIALYPQESGEISISPAMFEARVLRNGRITGRKVFQSDAHTIMVAPIPPPPADRPDASWLPARDVVLGEDWSRQFDELEAGEPVTREITLSALGQLETQLPAIDAPGVDGLNVYADKPEFGRTVEAGGIRGQRKDQYAIIGLAGGEVELPVVEVPWWDVEAAEWKVASLPARTLTVKGAGEPETVGGPSGPNDFAAEAAPTGAAPTGAAPAEGGVGGPSGPNQLEAITFWQRATEILAILWLLTLAAWWWSSRSAPRKRRESREPKTPPLHKQQSASLKKARDAAAAGDRAGVRAALLEWGRLQWPESAPRSIGEIANRVQAPLCDELRKLSSASYGPGGGDIDGATLAKALKSVTLVEAHETPSVGEMLPPLMPR
ncbi:MAG: BatD family protein [Gammaproteobacteria bacterium]|nr:BatD family protein [Gammaproteobacteria bacterium]NNF48812.1 protein BatD [Woeseiaceae bacterium]